MPTEPKDTQQGKDDEAFLSRWSRRKRTEADEPVAEDIPGDAADAPTDEEILAELDLPDPDTLKANDDFSAFMQARVPERLRRRALRTLWRSNPVLANLDELVDYGEDYTDAATVMENMQTVYEVGKGAAEKWKRHLAALADEETTEAIDQEPPAPVPDPETTAEAPPIEPSEPAPVMADAPIPVETAAVTPDPPARHMRFTFD